MRRISGILDKILTSLVRDNTLRKDMKKVTIPLPMLNVRATTYTTVGQVKERARGLNDEVENIMKLAFRPVDPNIEVRTLGDDIPDENEHRGRQDQGSRAQATAQATAPTQAPNNVGQRERLQVNFEEHEEQRRNTLTEVRNTMSIITNSGNQVNAAKVRANRQDGPFWTRNNNHG